MVIPDRTHVMHVLPQYVNQEVLLHLTGDSMNEFAIIINYDIGIISRLTTSIFDNYELVPFTNKQCFPDKRAKCTFYFMGAFNVSSHYGHQNVPSRICNCIGLNIHAYTTAQRCALDSIMR